MVMKVVCQFRVLLIICFSGMFRIIVRVVLVVSSFSVLVCCFGGVMCIVSEVVMVQNIVWVKVMLIWLSISIWKFQVSLDSMWLVMNSRNILISSLCCLILWVSSIIGNEVSDIIQVQMVNIRLICEVGILKLWLMLLSRLIGMNFVVLKMKVVRVRVIMFSQLLLWVLEVLFMGCLVLEQGVDGQVL